jgi:hypothetical protein
MRGRGQDGGGREAPDAEIHRAVVCRLHRPLHKSGAANGAHARSGHPHDRRPDATAVNAIPSSTAAGDSRRREPAGGYLPQAAWPRTYQMAMTLSGTPSSQATM